MAAGARGGIVAIACAAPKAALSLYRAFAAGDYKKAGVIQRIIAPPAGAVTERYSIAGLKAAMELEGFQAGVPRRHLLPLNPADHDYMSLIFLRLNNVITELS